MTVSLETVPAGSTIPLPADFGKILSLVLVVSMVSLTCEVPSAALRAADSAPIFLPISILPIDGRSVPAVIFHPLLRTAIDRR